ncbi:hypothetical protein BC332_11417 [Capsicum chinense]|nr:hypothetical protein BC332_11417 [Capsicum chinense]
MLPLTTAPPDPPDPPLNDDTTMEDTTVHKLSFKDILTDRPQELNQSYNTPTFTPAPQLPYGKKSIQLSDLEKERIYLPWRNLVTVKLMGRKISYQLLRSKIMELWKLSEPLTLINLGHGFYTAKLNKEESKTTTLHGGSWFIVGGFLSVIAWKPNFVPSTSTITHTVIWVRLPQLSTELYDQQILEKIGNHLGFLLKIDSCASLTLRGRYARICIQIPLGEPAMKTISIDDYTQQVEYEGDDALCMGCSQGKPHSENLYLHSTPTNDGTPTSSAINAISMPMTDKEEDIWKLVSFPKRRTQKNNSTDQVRDSVAKPSKYPPQTNSSTGNSMRSNTFYQPPKRSNDPSRQANRVKSQSGKDKAQNPNPGSSVDHKRSQTINNRFNGLNENILEEKNVQYTTIDDETLKVMSIKPHASLEGSTHIMDTLNFSENSSNVAPNAYDMTMEVIYLNSNLTNLSSPFKNGKNLPNTPQSCYHKNTHGQHSTTIHTKEPLLSGDCTTPSGALTNLLAGTTATGLPSNS